jgi:citrate synthase
LRYRGYSIEDLADKADFLECPSFIFGELTAVQLKNLKMIRKYTLVNEEMKSIIDGFQEQHIQWVY